MIDAPVFPIRLPRPAWITAVALATLLVSTNAGVANAQDGTASTTLQPVTLQLKWKHQFQFAGYYTAVEKGYYRNAGFEVRIREAGDGEDTITTVLTGKAEFGVASSELAQKRAMGAPVVALATILQHSALALAVRGSSTLTVHDLIGKRLMLTPHDTELFAYFKREGLPENRITRVPMNYRLDELIQGRVDAFSVYTTDQVWLLRKANFPHSVLSPRAAGIDFYGDTLFTSEAQVQDNKQRVAAFRDASLQGWRYAMGHPEEIADLILAKYSQRLSREHLLHEAGEMLRLMQPGLIEIGHMNPGRWASIGEVYADLGMLPRNHSLKGFLFDAAPQSRPWPLIAAGIAIGLVMLGLVFWIVRLRRKLRILAAASQAR
jgi:ABC-type nitrate/sulfonate/bicarbonate transport system substrate-binding protein